MSRWSLIVLATCVLGTACGDDTPTSPSGAPIVFSAQLSPANEVPPVGNAEAGGRGAVQITFDVTRDATDAITGGTASFHIQLTGFPAGITVVGAHIHPGAAGVNGPVILNTGITSTTAPATAGNFMTFDITGVALNAATAASIVANPAGHYFNVHSTMNPGGFARGQLTRIQ